MKGNNWTPALATATFMKDIETNNMIKEKQYLIIEQGQYSDYGVSFVEITNSPLSEAEILTLIRIDQYDEPTIGGRIKGELTLDGSFSLKDIKTEAKDNINRLFCCYKNRQYKTVLDKLYTKEECLKIATTNDGSTADYWKREIDEKYEQYLKAYPLYQKIISP